ncbi:hypothetical protein B0T26DRAFT_681062 [Lasiosphaeria miniovina]|uniref:Uncharacterized protein n=1 Tax=Lasiosphaeria miniovina TaxID=1954250 RepID=A0AA39ZTP0_9PEZI|nr:uncharacterized protein B0T26DRAFT_681062 [Lasiosphaeria miniovina]KAK0703380.1 hypothetical protein B0T26DRAFT_681062 [Lasiosphaeria miniovina]
MAAILAWRRGGFGAVCIMTRRSQSLRRHILTGKDALQMHPSAVPLLAPKNLPELVRTAFNRACASGDANFYPGDKSPDINIGQPHSIPTALMAIQENEESSWAKGLAAVSNSLVKHTVTTAYHDPTYDFVMRSIRTKDNDVPEGLPEPERGAET